MAKDMRQSGGPGNETVISIIGPGMRVVGDCDTQGTLRIEGTVEGTVRAGKAVVIGKDGNVQGDVITQDAVVGGRVVGSIIAESRLELQATCVIDGEIRARRLKLDEGGTVSGEVRVGEVSRPPQQPSSRSTVSGSAAGASASAGSGANSRSSGGTGGSGESAKPAADSL